MLIEIDKIKVSDRIRKDYGNLQELADDIKQNGLINPPVVTPDTYELIAGERRLRAMKLLGYKQIEVRPMAVKDAEHQLNLEISENESRKEFTKSERIDYARQLERIESAKAKQRQGTRTDICPNLDKSENIRTDEIVAKQLGIGGKDTYRKEKFIVDNKSSLTPQDFADWDEGKLSTNKAFKKIKAEKENLERKVREFENRKHVVETNPALLLKLKQLEHEVESLNIRNECLEHSKELSEKLAEKYKKDSEEYSKVKTKVLELGLDPGCDYNVYDAAKKLTELNTDLLDLLQNKLAPIKYQPFLITLNTNNILRENLIGTLNLVFDWYESMMRFIGEEIPLKNEYCNEIIDMEENNGVI